jgi:hypothetical protein
MEILFRKLHGASGEEIDYPLMMGDFQKSKEVDKSKYANYLVHGIQENLISADNLLFNSIVYCETLKECDIIGLSLRLGANVHRFYNDRNIMWYVIEKFHKTNKELFVFVSCMLFIRGLGYNDFMYRERSDLIHSYFKEKGIELFHPHTITMENQKYMNLCLDSDLDGKEYHYSVEDMVGHLAIELIKSNVVKRQMVNCEDELVSLIIDSGNLNMFVTAVESSYLISYFSMERLRLLLINSDDDILRGQWVEMVEYLDNKNILFDYEQYLSICRVIPHIKFVERDNKSMEKILEENKKLLTPKFIFGRFRFTPNYIHLINNEGDLKNLMYKLLIYKVKELGLHKVLDII